MSEEIICNTVVELFEKQVERTPYQTAVVFKNQTISYDSLNRRANKFARMLRNKGIGRETLVAVLADKGIDTVAAILGIMKSGGAYLPIDPDYPPERIRYMLEDSGAKLVYTDGYEGELPEGLGIVDASSREWKDESDENPSRVNESNDLLYVIYTSGTTGMPKGVMLEHHGVVNLNRYFAEDYGVNENDVVLQFANLTFDGSVYEMSMALLSGATLCVVPKEMKNDIEWFEEYLSRHSVSIMALPPQFFAQIEYDGARIVVTAGSESNRNVVEKALRNGGRYINSYGPTESTVCATHWDAVPGKVPATIPIGRPIHGAEILILNGLELCQEGTPGELCIAGAGLARGYLNRPELTAEKFIDNPFGAGRLYRTGDLARWASDGNIEFLGRIDDQVKIRGFRVELGEVENVIREAEGIKDVAVVVCADENGDKEINAYFVSDHKIDISLLRTEMGKKLPEYMIPAGMMQIEKIPLTANGKPDKKALPKIERVFSEKNYIAPRNAIEQLVADAFSEILKIKRIGVTESFYEIGGDSIKAIRVSSRLRESGYAVKVSDILNRKTVEKIALYISENNAAVEEYSQDEISGEVELMPIHDEFFAWNLAKPGHFNQSNILFGSYEPDAAEKAFDELFRHHDALRIIYDGHLHILPYSSQKFLTVIDVEGDDKETVEKIIEEESTKIHASIDMSRPPLIKAGLFRSRFGDCLLIVIHHLAIDVVSWRILLEDFETAYNCIINGREVKLPKKTASYQEWNKRLNHYGHSSEVRRTSEYWREINSRVKDGQLVGDTSGKKAFRADKIVVGSEVIDKLRSDALKPFGCKPNAILLSALTKAVHELTGQSRVAVKMEGHGREKLEQEIDVSRTVGWFTNAYPIVTEYRDSISDLIIGVKETIRSVPYKGMGYGFIRRELDDVNDADLLFNFFGENDAVENKRDNQLHVTGGQRMAKENTPGENIQFTGGIDNGVLSMDYKYNTGKYSDEFARRLKAAFVDCLSETVDFCTRQTEIVKTPSDYDCLELSMTELNKIKALYPQERIDKIYQLTPMQQGMLYHKVLDEDATSYVLQDIAEVKGKVSAEIIKEAAVKTVERFDVLRTRFIYRTLDQAMQIVLKEADFEYSTVYLPSDDKDALMRIAADDVIRGFELEHESPVRVTLVIAGEKQYMIWSFHHIIIDGWCTPLIFGEFTNNCRLLAQNQNVVIQPNESFAEFVAWIKEQDREAGRAYFGRLLSGYENVAEIKSFGTDMSKPDITKLKERAISKELFEDIERFCKEHDVTLNTIAETAVGILLQKYTRSPDAVFGKVVSGRNAPINNIESAVGLFINTIPVRVSSGEGVTCKDAILSVEKQNVDGTAYHYMSLSEIQSASEVGDGLIKLLFAFENYYLQENGSDDPDRIDLETVFAREEQNYDMAFSAYAADTLHFKLEYKNRLYTDEETDIILDRLETLLNQMIRTPEKLVSQLESATEKEKNEILPSFNSTEFAYDESKTIVDLFREQVEKQPESVAVNLMDERLTYRELDKLSNRIARQLICLGVEKGELVAIIAERTIGTVAGILGIIKAGGAYVPVNPAYPKDRIEYMLQDSGTKVLIQGEDELPVSFDGNVLKLSELSEPNDSDVSTAIRPEDAAYVIYTSGTTGKPKGVILEHRGLLNANLHYKRELEITPDDVVIQFANMSFDASVSEIFMALLNGARLCLVTREIIDDTSLFTNYTQTNRVTIATFPPQYYMQLGDIHIDKIITAGSETNTDVIRQGLKNKKYINAYGPTENTICATSWDVKEFSETTRIHIGKPIENVRVYILDGTKLCGVGIPGELCVAGKSLARGYLNRPELTAEKFIPNPYEEGRLYRTGDLARWLPDGNIEFLGRIDDQIKIRGFRVELGEIEETIRKAEGVFDAAVIVSQNENNEKAIYAYVVSDQNLDLSVLRRSVAKTLPDYMIPSGFMQIDKIPLTPNGKPDKKVLPKIESISSGEDYVAPRTELEQMVAQVFEEVLRLRNVGVSDSFYEIGGDSIKAIRVSSKMREKGYSVKVSDILNLKTAENIAAFISDNHSVAEEYSQDEVTGEVEMMPIHDEFFGWHLAKPEHFNQSQVIFGRFDKELVEKALNELYRHHDALRIVFDGQLKIMPYTAQSFVTDFDITALDRSEAEGFIRSHAAEIQSGFELTKQPLMKAGLFRTAYGDYLLIAIHHLAVDVVSWKTLLEDFETACNCIRSEKEVIFPKKTASYQEWAKKLNEYGRSPEVLNTSDYWKSVNDEVKDGLVSGDRNEDVCYAFRQISVDRETTDRLRYESLRAFGCEISDILLSTLTAAVHDITGQRKAAFELEGHGREKLLQEIDVSRTVGWFTNSYPVVFEYSEDIAKLVVGVKEKARAIPNKGMGYGFIRREMEEVNAPDILFNYVGEFDGFNEQTTGELHVESGPEVAPENVYSEDIQLNGGIADGVLTFILHSRTNMTRQAKERQEFRRFQLAG